MFDNSDLARSIPIPKETANKYSRGKCVLIAGSVPYPGAACLASWASQYVGAGYSEVFTAAGNELILQITRPSLVVRSFEAANPKNFLSADHPGAIVCGPGIDAKDERAYKLFLKIVRKVDHPVLLDGGALSFAATDKGRAALVSRAEKGWITLLTPHGGEAARLAKPFGIEVSDVSLMASELARSYGALVVLKGPKTHISDGEKTELFSKGTPALAKAGTGDVLAGMLGGLLAQGLAPFDVARLGVALHAQAALVAAEEFSEVSVCAEEVVRAIPRAIKVVLDE